MTVSAALSHGVVLRPLTPDDAPGLLEATLRNREHLRPHEPDRPAAFWTLDGQRDRLRTFERERQEGTRLACALFRGEVVVGCATLNEIVLGPLRSASLGYWVDADEVGRGLATAATEALCRIADTVLGLHRVQATTQPSNLASQRVLVKSGFEQFGTARQFLHLNGRWQDSHFFHRILNDRPPPLA
jgi:ribosomal-protein-alanine N-acetyltransferase